MAFQANAYQITAFQSGTATASVDFEFRVGGPNVVAQFIPISGVAFEYGVKKRTK